MSRPERACATRSYAGASASGPASPNEVTTSDDERGMRRVQRLPAEPEPRRALARGVVERDVGSCRAAASSSRPLARLQVDDDRALAAVERHEVAPDTRRDRQDVAVAVPGWWLDLDHVRAEIGQQHAAERPGDVLRVLDDAHAFERKAHRSPSPRRAITTCEDLRRAARDGRADRRAVETADPACERCRRVRVGEPFEPEQLDALASQALGEARTRELRHRRRRARGLAAIEQVGRAKREQTRGGELASQVGRRAARRRRAGRSRAAARRARRGSTRARRASRP